MRRERKEENDKEKEGKTQDKGEIEFKGAKIKPLCWTDIRV